MLMSIVPLTFLITLLFGKATAFTGSRIANFSVFESVEEIFEYIRIEATRATSAASVFLVITTLYSSTNLFYQMRKSGELIYEIKIPHKGIKYRLDALVLLFYVLLLFVVLALSLG
ncbi:MAG: hypothetical protein IJV80_03100, partial [Clostridia bacterium]|nr:hypothetical protein [Clostridia bacterium]